jgi:hypothetical protein
MTAYDDFDDDPDELIENGAEHKYLRRIPWPGHKKKYRYVYDPRIAAQLPVKPAPGEKVRVPHGAQAGHYEVLRVQRMGEVTVADLRHDETGHRMLVRTDALHKLVQDVFMPPGTPPRRPSKQEAEAAAKAAAKEAAAAAKRSRTDVEKLKKAHRLADALPRERWKVLDIILDDNRIEDYDLSKRDWQYLAWQRGEAKKPPPLPRTDGMLDAFMASGDRKTKFCCLREAFNHALATSKAKTWRQVAPLLDMLRTVPGLQDVQMPSFVTARHTQEEIELRGQEEGLRPTYPDYTRYGVAYDPNMGEEDLLLEAVTYDRDRPALPAGRQPGEDADLPSWPDEDEILPF